MHISYNMSSFLAQGAMLSVVTDGPESSRCSEPAYRYSAAQQRNLFILYNCKTVFINAFRVRLSF